MWKHCICEDSSVESNGCSPTQTSLVLRSETKLSKWEDVFCNFEDKLPESLTRWSCEKKVPQPPISHSGKMQLKPFTIQTYENPTGFLYEKVLWGGKSNMQILVNIFFSFSPLWNTARIWRSSWKDLQLPNKQL